MGSALFKSRLTHDLGRFSGPGWKPDPFQRITALIAQVAVVIVGFDYFVALGVNLSLVVAVASLPLWLRTLRTYPLAPTIGVLSLVALAWGFMLGVGSSADHQVNQQGAVTLAGVLLAGVSGFMLILWAREFVALTRVVFLFGVGSLASALLFSSRDWKFDLSVPVTFIVLGIAERSRSRLLPAAAMVALGILSVVNGARSYFAFAVIAAMLTLWQGIRVNTSVRRRKTRWFPAILLAALGLVTYLAMSSLLAGGFFGASLQQRSSAQIDETGSLIAGGRPEWAATRELLRTTPHGYGIGVVPTWTDLQAGRAGLASINVDAGGYTTNYMFGGAFELHSILADLWVSCGFVGFALGVLIFYLLVRNLSHLLAAGTAPTIVIFSTCVGLWSLLFGPLYTDWLPVMVALGLSMLTGEQHGMLDPPDEAAT